MRTLTENDKNMIENLRDRGFAVVVYSPDELEGVDPDTLESDLVTFGNHTLEVLSDYDS